MLLTSVEAALVSHCMSCLDSIAAKMLVTVRDVDVVDNPSGTVLIMDHHTAAFELYDSRREFRHAYEV